MCKDAEKKRRIDEFGEVFTPDNIVCDMLDMLEEQQPLDIDTTVLEPTCGDGQILLRILFRKLKKVKELDKSERPLGLFRALSSVYGVDIQEDNTIIARRRLKALIIGNKVGTFCTEGRFEAIQIENLSIDIEKYEHVIDYILTNNIICGNTLEVDDTEDTFVNLTSYNWIDTKSVEIAICPITALNLEIDKHILSVDEINKFECKIEPIPYVKQLSTINKNIKKALDSSELVAKMQSADVPF